MMSPHADNLPQGAVSAAAFANSLSLRARSQGITDFDLFGAFAGLVAAMDAKIAATCLVALDEAISGGIATGDMLEAARRKG